MRKLVLIVLGILLVSTAFVVALNLEQDMKVTVLVGDLNIFSPMEGKAYDQRIIPVMAIMSEKADYFKISDNGGRFRTLCRNCETYGFYASQLMGFDDGFHKVEFLAIFSNRTVSQNVSFFVDSQAPKLLKTEPKKLDVTNGSGFYLKYTEENVRELYLEAGSKVNLTTQCNSPGKNQECFFDIDLSAYDGQEIIYWFNMTDIADHETGSRPTRVVVDTSAPVLTINSPDVLTYSTRRVPFNISVTEEVDLEYSDNGGSFKNLCSDCESYGVDKKKTRSFTRGTHDIIIRATDRAGNTNTEGISFDVD